MPIPLNDAAPAAVIVAPILTAGLPAKNPPRAVTTPTESIFVTSSCVNVPPIVTFPLKYPVVDVVHPVTTTPLSNAGGPPVLFLIVVTLIWDILPTF